MVNTLSVMFLDESRITEFSEEFKSNLNSAKELIGKRLKTTTHFTNNGVNVNYEIVRVSKIQDMKVTFKTKGSKLVNFEFRALVEELSYVVTSISGEVVERRENSNFEMDVKLDTILDGGYVFEDKNTSHVKMEIL